MKSSSAKANIIDAITLKKLNLIQNKTLQSVICYLWLNQVNPKETIDVIDAVEFQFTDSTNIVLSGNESQEGIQVIEYNFDEQKAYLEKEFNGKIKIYRVVANNTEMWKNVINTKLEKIRLTKDQESDNYLCDEIVFEFENQEMRLIQIHPIDGLILNYYEEI